MWNPDFTRVDSTYLIDFPYQGHKFTYGASCAIDLNITQISKINKVIRSFDLVSLRERNTIIQLQANKHIYNVLDPVFLLSRTEWQSLFSHRTHKQLQKEYIFVYDLICDKKIIDVALNYSRKLGLPIISYSGNKGYNGKSARMAGPLDFLEFINNATLVITSSSHGLAFSIVFRKNFYVQIHPKRGSRMVELLDKFNLYDRALFDDLSEYSEINYHEVEKFIEKELEISKRFIKTMLEINDAN